MKKLFRGSLFFLVLILSSCGASMTSSIIKSYPTLDYNQEVIVLGLNEDIPSGAEHLGTIKVGDSGFSTHCNYDLVIDNASLEARRVGGNAIKIVKHKKPDLWSSCHRITVEILRLQDQ